MTPSRVRNVEEKSIGAPGDRRSGHHYRGHHRRELIAPDRLGQVLYRWSNMIAGDGLLAHRSRTRPRRPVPRLRAEGDRRPGAAGLGGGAVPHRPAPRDGRAGAARHARPRGVGRHRHVDGRLRRGDGADRAWPTSRWPPRGRPTSPSGRCRCTCSAPTSSASAGSVRWPRAGRSARSGSPSPTPGPTPRGISTRAEPQGRRLADQRPQDVHLERRHRHVVRRDAARPHRPPRASGPATAASWSRRTRPASRWARRCGASAGRASTPASCSSTTCGCPTSTSWATPRWGSGSSCGRWRSGRISIAALSLSLTQAVLDLATDYAKERKQFGQPIS